MFHEYLCESKFIVYTDSNPLTYVLTAANLDATIWKLFATLANCDFSITYRSRKVSTDGDVLSRINPFQFVPPQGCPTLSTERV